VLVAALILAVLVPGCKSGAIKDVITQGTEIAGQIEAQKAAEKAAKEAARVAAEKAEADKIAAEKAEAERKEAAEEAALVAQYAAGPNAIEHGKRFLWKAVSDNSGMPVIVIGSRFTHKIKTLTVNGETIKRAGVANGWREHYRLRKHYDGPVTVVAIARDGDTGTDIRWTWVVPNGRVRHDGVITPKIERL
jgi:hypothetical protein